MKKLLNPVDLAVKPQTFNIQVGDYDHSTQSTLSLTRQLAEYGTTTFGATQTYNMQGQPSDSDNDKD